MRWFSSRRSKQRQPAWEYSAQGFIWRLMPGFSGYIVGEDRDPVKKSVSFFCLDREHGTVLWNRRDMSEQWWISLDSIYRNTIFLHEYTTPDMPDQKKIFALDIKTGNIRWSNDELRFLFAHDSSVYASKDGFEQRQFFEMNNDTGDIVKEVSTDELGKLRESSISDVVQLDFPRVVDFFSLQNDKLARAVKEITPEDDRIELLEHIEMTGTDVVSFYEHKDANLASRSFRQHFIIVGKEHGDIQYHDVLSDEVNAAVPDTFFAWNDFVYCIKEKKVLRGINLLSNAF